MSASEKSPLSPLYERGDKSRFPFTKGGDKNCSLYKRGNKLEEKILQLEIEKLRRQQDEPPVDGPGYLCGDKSSILCMSGSNPCKLQ